MIIKPTGCNFFAAVKSSDVNIAISGNFVLTAKNSKKSEIQENYRFQIRFYSHRAKAKNIKRACLMIWSGCEVEGNV